jgi:hypothetical protein
VFSGMNSGKHRLLGNILFLQFIPVRATLRPDASRGGVVLSEDINIS